MKRFSTLLFPVLLCSSLSFYGCAPTGDDDDDGETTAETTTDEGCDDYEDLYLGYMDFGEADLDTAAHTWDGEAGIYLNSMVILDWDYMEVDVIYECYAYGYSEGTELPPQEGCPEGCTSSWEVNLIGDVEYDEGCEWTDLYLEVLDEVQEGLEPYMLSDLFGFGTVWFGIHPIDDYWFEEMGYTWEDICPDCNIGISEGHPDYGWFSEEYGDYYSQVWVGQLDETTEPNSLYYQSPFNWVTYYYYEYCMD